MWYVYTNNLFKKNYNIYLEHFPYTQRIKNNSHLTAISIDGK